MLGLFYQYLIHHNKLVLPGLGAVTVQRKAAVSDFADHAFLPPSYSFQWDRTHTIPSPDFFRWLSGKLDIAEEDAALQVNNYIAELKKEINAGREIGWEGVGVIRRGLDSSIELEPVHPELLFEKKVYGDKVIHENRNHTILVGDEERNSAEMPEILGLPERKKFTWFHMALLIAALALVFIIIYMIKNGWVPGSASNQNKIAPKDEPATYREMQ